MIQKKPVLRTNGLFVFHLTPYKLRFGIYAMRLALCAMREVVSD